MKRGARRAKGRMSKWLQKMLSTYSDDFAALGIRPGDCSVHSIRKAVASFLSNKPGGPSMATIFQRCGWSLGNVPQRYLWAGQGGDEQCGRTASLLDPCDPKFASLPPHFASNPLSKEEWESILPGYGNYFPSSFMACLPMLLAQLVHHRDFISQNFNSWFHHSPVFMSGLLEKLEVLGGVMFNPISKMTASGIPPTVAIMVELRDLRDETSSLRDSVAELAEKSAAQEASYSRMLSEATDKMSQVIPQAVSSLIAKDFNIEGIQSFTKGEFESMISSKFDEMQDFFKKSLSNTLLTRAPPTLDEVLNNEESATATIPESYTIKPLCLFDLFHVWFRGEVFVDAENRRHKIPPYYLLNSKNFPLKRDKDQLSKARVVVKRICGSSYDNVIERLHTCGSNFNWLNTLVADNTKRMYKNSNYLKLSFMSVYDKPFVFDDAMDTGDHAGPGIPPPGKNSDMDIGGITGTHKPPISNPSAPFAAANSNNITKIAKLRVSENSNNSSSSNNNSQLLTPISNPSSSSTAANSNNNTKIAKFRDSESSNNNSNSNNNSQLLTPISNPSSSSAAAKSIAEQSQSPLYLIAESRTSEVSRCCCGCNMCVLLSDQYCGLTGDRMLPACSEPSSGSIGGILEAELWCRSCRLKSLFATHFNSLVLKSSDINARDWPDGMEDFNDLARLETNPFYPETFFLFYLKSVQGSLLYNFTVHDMCRYLDNNFYDTRMLRCVPNRSGSEILRLHQVFDGLDSIILDLLQFMVKEALGTREEVIVACDLDDIAVQYSVHKNTGMQLLPADIIEYISKLCYVVKQESDQTFKYATFEHRKVCLPRFGISQDFWYDLSKLRFYSPSMKRTYDGVFVHVKTQRRKEEMLVSEERRKDCLEELDLCRNALDQNLLNNILANCSVESMSKTKTKKKDCFYITCDCRAVAIGLTRLLDRSNHACFNKLVSLVKLLYEDIKGTFSIEKINFVVTGNLKNVHSYFRGKQKDNLKQSSISISSGNSNSNSSSHCSSVEKKRKSVDADQNETVHNSISPTKKAAIGLESRMIANSWPKNDIDDLLKQQYCCCGSCGSGHIPKLYFNSDSDNNVSISHLAAYHFCSVSNRRLRGAFCSSEEEAGRYSMCVNCVKNKK